MAMLNKSAAAAAKARITMGTLMIHPSQASQSRLSECGSFIGQFLDELGRELVRAAVAEALVWTGTRSGGDDVAHAWPRAAGDAPGAADGRPLVGMCREHDGAGAAGVRGID